MRLMKHGVGEVETGARITDRKGRNFEILMLLPPRELPHPDADVADSGMIQVRNDWGEVETYAPETLGCRFVD